MDLESNKPEKLKAINLKQKTLFIFVRHRGCTFCRETLTNLKSNLHLIKKLNLMPVVIHMGDELSSELMQEEFGLTDVHFIADPERELYRMFGARRGSVKEVLGPKVIARGVFGGALAKYGVGKLEGDGFQLGGVYLYHGGEVSCLHRPENAADIEDWPKLLGKI